MFQYEFITNAFIASGIVAVVSGVTGYFLVMRGQTFAGHALSHIGFAGATGAGLIGLSPLWGLVGFTLMAGIGMGLMSERISNRDVAIGVVLALSLGFGLLFLHYYTSFASQATALLFGKRTQLALTIFYSLAVVLISAALFCSGVRWPAWLGLAAFAAHLAWQVSTIRISDSALCLRLFKSNRNAGLMLFAGLLVDAVLRSS